VLKSTYSYNSFKLLGLPLGVKARVNKLNSPRIDWRRRLGWGIGLLFGLDIVASKEYCLTIMVQKLLINMLLLAAPAVLQRYRISHRLGVGGKKKAQCNVMRCGTVAAEHMYLRSLQDVARLIVRVEGVGR
jgi:hypothetical protein